MTNSIPYLILTFLAISTLAFLLIRTRSLLNAVLFLSFAGMIYVFEYTIFVCFDAYTYYPQIFADPYLDSMIGSFVSNFLTVPVISLTIAVFDLRLPWAVFFALFMVGVEWLFLHLGIYDHNWWRLTYSLCAFLFFFRLARFWAGKVRQGKPVFRFFTFFLFALIVTDSLAALQLYLRISSFHIGVFADPTRDSAFFTLPYAFMNSLLLANAVYWTGKLRWAFGALLAIFVIHVLLIKLGILSILVSPGVYWLLAASASLPAAWVILYGARLCRGPQGRIEAQAK